MISAWDVYWVMQLDSIKEFLIILSVIAIMATCVGTVIGSVLRSEGDTDGVLIHRYVFKVVAPLALIFGVLQSLTPSSKTAAAMLILPALTSDTVVEAVAPEARELYDLAKDALRSVSNKTAPPVEPKPEK